MSLCISSKVFSGLSQYGAHSQQTCTGCEHSLRPFRHTETERYQQSHKQCPDTWNILI